MTTSFFALYGIVFAYLLVAGVTLSLLRDSCEDEFGRSVLALIWPIVLPIVLASRATEGFRDWRVARRTRRLESELAEARVVKR